MQIGLKNMDISSVMQKQKIILPIITFLITLMMAKNIYQGQRLKLESIKQQIGEEGRISELVKTIKAQNDKLSEYREKYGPKDYSLIMQEISGFAAAAGIKILSLSPLSVIRSDILQIFPFSLRIEGSYHKIGDFIAKVESSANLLRISKFQLSQSGSGGKEEVLGVSLTINALSLVE